MELRLGRVIDVKQILWATIYLELIVSPSRLTRPVCENRGSPT